MHLQKFVKKSFEKQYFYIRLKNCPRWKFQKAEIEIREMNEL